MKKRRITYMIVSIIIGILYFIKVSTDKSGYFDIWIQGAFLLVILVIGGILYLKKEINNKFKIVILLIAIALFVSYPLYNDYLIYSHDINFHLVRIEGLKEALGEGQIPARMHSIENNGYGYATSLIYPELFLYIPSILRLLNTSMVFSFKILLIFINIAAIFSMYISVKKMSKSTTAAILAAIIYAAANYRLEVIFTRAAIGEALALAFYPIAIWGLYELFLGDKKKWYIFVIGFTFILQSHMISILLMTLICVIIGLYFIKNIMKEKRYKAILLAIITTILLNVWFLVPFLDIYNLNLNVKNTGIVEFDKYTVIPAQLFNIFDTADSYRVSNDNEQGMDNEMAYSLGILCSIGLIISVVYCLKNRNSNDKTIKWIRILTIIAVLFLIATTTIVPWKELQDKFGVIRRFCMIIQFAWRFLGVSTVMLTITMSMIIGKYMTSKDNSDKDLINSYKILIGVGIIAFISVPLFLGEYSKRPKVYIHESELTYDMSGYFEYFIEGTNTSLLKENKYNTSSSKVTISKYTKEGNKITLNYNNREGKGYIEVPLLYYPGYVARDESGKKLNVVCGENNVVRVELTQAKQGTIIVEYRGKGSYIFANIVSVLTLCGLFYYIRRTKKQNKSTL